MENRQINYTAAYRRDDIEIDLVDLFLEILSHWRILIIVGAAAAIIAGGAGAVKELRSFPKDHQKKVEEYERQLAEYEAAVSARNAKIQAYEEMYSAMENYRILLDRKKEFLEKSVYLNLDPFRVTESTAAWKVIIDDKEWEKYREGLDDPTDEIVVAYSNARFIINWESIAQAVNEEPGSIPDLVSVYSDLNSNEVLLRVIYKDKEGAEKIADMVISQLSEAWKKVKTTLPNHKIEITRRNTRVIAVTGIEDARKAQTDAINVYTDKISTLERNLEAAKNPYSEKEPAEPSDSVIKEGRKKAVLKGGMKYAIIGLFAGLFILAGILTLQYLVPAKLRTGDELSDIYGIEVLSDLSLAKDDENKNPIDRLIDRLKGKGSAEKSELIQRSAIRIDRLSESRSVLLTGTVPTERLEEISVSLKEKTGDISFSCGKDIRLDNDTLDRVKEGTEVIIIEEKNHSGMDSVGKEIDLIRAQQGKILGAVIV